MKNTYNIPPRDNLTTEPLPVDILEEMAARYSHAALSFIDANAGGAAATSEQPARAGFAREVGSVTLALDKYARDNPITLKHSWGKIKAEAIFNPFLHTVKGHYTGGGQWITANGTLNENGQIVWSKQVMMSLGESVMPLPCEAAADEIQHLGALLVGDALLLVEADQAGSLDNPRHHAEVPVPGVA